MAKEIVKENDVLHRFSLNKPETSDITTTTPRETILGTFDNYGGFQGFNGGVFLTKNSFTKDDKDGNDARNSLAITYSPRFKTSFELKSQNSYRLVNSYGVENEYNRVWPAFGHCGTAWEIILVGNSSFLTKTGNIENFEVNYIDNFCQDSAFTEDFHYPKAFLTELATLFYEIWEVDIWRQENQNISITPIGIKINRGSGIAITYIVNEYIKCTISCAFKGKKKTSLRFWQYLWLDDEIEGFRYIIKPLNFPLDVVFNDIDINSLRDLLEEKRTSAKVLYPEDLYILRLKKYLEIIYLQMLINAQRGYLNNFEIKSRFGEVPRNNFDGHRTYTKEHKEQIFIGSRRIFSKVKLIG